MVDKRRIKAIDLFFNYWEDNSKILPLEEFIDLWGGKYETTRTYYYQVKRKFIELFKELNNI